MVVKIIWYGLIFLFGYLRVGHTAGIKHKYLNAARSRYNHFLHSTSKVHVSTNLTIIVFSWLRKISSINPTGVIRAQDGRDRDRSTELSLKFTSTTCTSTGIVVLAEKDICSVWLRAGPFLPSSAVNNVAHSCVLENNTCVFAPWTSWYISQYEFDPEYHWRAWVLTQVVRAACHALTTCSSNIGFVDHVVGWIARGRSSVGGNCAAIQGNDTNLAVIEPGSGMLTEDEVTEPWVSLG